MVFFILAGTCLVFGVFEVFRHGLPQGKIGLELGRAVRVKNLIQDLEEQLMAGIVPRSERWGALADLPPPWAPHLSESVLELRKNGGAVLPTLRRMKALALAHERSLLEGCAKSAQAWVQALLCLALVPLFSLLLYGFLPGLEGARFEWIALTLFSLLLGIAAAFWIMSLSEAARWGGLNREEQAWVMPVLCFGERILALIQSGQASDQAWTLSLQVLPAALQTHWKGSIFELSREGARERSSVGVSLSQALRSVGPQLKRSIHASLIEGRPCFERIELVLQGFQTEMKAHQERELQLLATRAMKPLFICVAPALFMLLIGGLFISFFSISGF